MSDGASTTRDPSGDASGPAALPAAVVRPARRVSWAWAIPVLAIVLAGALAVSAWRQRGLVVSVLLPDGHGLKVGDAVRYRGITVGEVRTLDLTADLDGVVAGVALHVEGERLARAGSRFWVVRPRVALSGVEGVETLLGPRYLAVLPAPTGAGRTLPQREFVGLAEPPVVEAIAPDDLEIVLAARQRGSIRPGAPVSYRQVRIGTILSVGVNSDGSEIEARAHVLKAFRALVRRNSRFWDAGGVRAALGLSGLSVEIDSLEELVRGGVALATPPPESAGPGVRTGHRFELATEPEPQWLAWEPAVAVGSTLLPPGAVLPQPLRASIAWEQGFIVKSERTRRGWVLQTAEGLLGPADLLTPPAGKRADRETVSLEVAGQAVPLDDARVQRDGLIAVLAATVSDAVWPPRGLRRPAQPEDCIAVADPTAPPLPLAVARLGADGADAATWTVDPAVAADETWHGASVVSRADGSVVGVLIVHGEGVRVALVRGAGEE